MAKLVAMYQHRLHLIDHGYRRRLRSRIGAYGTSKSLVTTHIAFAHETVRTKQ